MASEFVIKHGFISKGDSIVNGTISGETLNLTTIPSNDNSLTQVLVRNNTTGVVEYRDASSLSGGSGTNTFVTGTTFGSNQSITRRNDGADVLILTGGTNVTLSNPSTNQIKIDVNIPAGMNTYVTGFTYNDNNTFTIFDNDGGVFPATINQVSGLTVNGILSATTISGGTFYGDGSNLTGISTDDNYVTGGTFSTNTLTLNRQNGSVTVTGFTSDSNTFVTGGTYNASTVTLDFSGNTGFSPFNVDVSALKDDTNTYVTGNTYTSATNTTNQSLLNLLYPYSLSSEDTFVTGTTFGSNQATVTRNDGTDVLFLTGGTNVTLSNPSSNQIKIDVSSLSSIDTGNVLWVDNIFGDDGTALVDRQDKPWVSIATAIGNASTNDTIMVRPGEYVEPDFTLVPSTSLVSQGGAKVTFISAATPTGNFITVSGSSYMEGFTIYTPTDDSAALYFNDSTAGIVTSFHNVHFKGSSTTPGPLGKGIVMDTGLASNGKIIYSELRYGGGNLDRLVEVNKGIFALDGMHVPGGGTITKGIQGNGGRLQLINVNIGNPLCDTALSVSGTSSNKPTVAGFGFNIFNVPTGIEITSNDYDIEVQQGRLDAGTTNLLITSGLTGSNGKLNLTSFAMDSTKLSVPYTWVNSPHTFQFSDIGNSQNIEPILRSWSNFEVGHANKGFDTSLGRGSEYQNGMHVHTSGTSNTTNVSVSAKTEGTTWTFESLTAGEELYIGSDQRYSNGEYLNFNAFNVTYTGSTGGTYTMEFYSGGTWVDINYQCVHHELGHNYGNTLFGRNVASDEVIRFGMDEEYTWDSTTIAGFGGHTAKWIRITMVTPPASLPQFDLVWLDPSHTEINKNGILNFYGNSLYRDTLVSAGNIFGLDGSVTSGLVDVGSTVTWTHVLPDSQFEVSGGMMGGVGGDEIMLQTILPKGTCTAYPLRVIIHYILTGSGPLTALPEIILSVVGKETYNNFNADPTGGIAPTRRTLSNTNTLAVGGQEYLIDLGESGENFSSEYLAVTDEYDFDISSLYESDGVFIRVEFEYEGAPTQTIIFPAIEVSVVKWALGERTRIE